MKNQKQCSNCGKVQELKSVKDEEESFSYRVESFDMETIDSEPEYTDDTEKSKRKKEKREFHVYNVIWMLMKQSQKHNI